jgi:hypothetical protein
MAHAQFAAYQEAHAAWMEGRGTKGDAQAAWAAFSTAGVESDRLIKIAAIAQEARREGLSYEDYIDPVQARRRLDALRDRLFPALAGIR